MFECVFDSFNASIAFVHILCPLIPYLRITRGEYSSLITNMVDTFNIIEIKKTK